MSRLALLTAFLVALFVGTGHTLARQSVEQPSASGGIGNTRADLSAVYGAVERTEVTKYDDYAVDAVSYETEWVFYLIPECTSPTPSDRAFIIHRYADAFDSYDYSEAIDLANHLLPSDVVPTSDLVPFEFNGRVLEYRQSFYSDSIALLFPDTEIYREGEPGTVWLVLTPDATSTDPSTHFINVNVRLEHP